MNCGPSCINGINNSLEDLNDWWEKNKRRLELDTAKWVLIAFGVIILVKRLIEFNLVYCRHWLFCFPQANHTENMEFLHQRWKRVFLYHPGR